jgi:hypothetical protein
MVPLIVTAGMASLLALVVMVLGWHRIEHMRKLRRYDAQWKRVKEQSTSDDPIVRRAAAQQALKLLNRGPR